MYSGTTLTRLSGRVLGTHQKIDRVARRQLEKLLPDSTAFPAARRIVHFEGFHGPDAIKRKSPAKDELWHFFNPFDDKDTKLIVLIQDHYEQLVKELRKGNEERSAFEAAWLSHAIVDGLTPAHHYPYEDELIKLMDGKSLDTRTTVLKKNILSGDTKRKVIIKNWKMWGPRGLRMGHGLFELGVATLIAPLSFGELKSDQLDIKKFKQLGISAFYRQIAREVAVQELYTNYLEKGWTPKLAWQIRHQLGPKLVEVVTLVWYCAAVDSGRVKP